MHSKWLLLLLLLCSRCVRSWVTSGAEQMAEQREAVRGYIAWAGHSLGVGWQGYLGVWGYGAAYFSLFAAAF